MNYPDTFRIIIFSFGVFVLFYMALMISNLVSKRFGKKKNIIDEIDNLDMPASSDLEKIERLIQLKKEGEITEDEYEILKKKIIDNH